MSVSNQLLAIFLALAVLVVRADDDEPTETPPHTPDPRFDLYPSLDNHGHEWNHDDREADP